VQAAGRIPVNVAETGVDLYSLSGHKMNAPKGTGALYVRGKTPLEPIHFGGHHERDRRAGTENVAGAIAMGIACDQTRGNLRSSDLRDRLERAVLERIPNSRINAARASRLTNTTNIRFPGVSGEALVIALDLAGFAVSTGAACSSGSIEPSHVLLAMGLSDADARASLRFSLGLGNTEEQVDSLVDALAAAVERTRSRAARGAYQNA
jgi:cysteine desulfurase